MYLVNNNRGDYSRERRSVTTRGADANNNVATSESGVVAIVGLNSLGDLFRSVRGGRVKGVSFDVIIGIADADGGDLSGVGLFSVAILLLEVKSECKGQLGSIAIKGNDKSSGGGRGVGGEGRGEFEGAGSELLEVVEVGTGDSVGVLLGVELNPVISSDEGGNEGIFGRLSGLLVRSPIEGDGSRLRMAHSGSQDFGLRAIVEDQVGERAKAIVKVVRRIKAQRVTVGIISHSNFTTAIDVELSLRNAIRTSEDVQGAEFSTDSVVSGSYVQSEADHHKGTENSGTHLEINKSIKQWAPMVLVEL